MGGQAIGTTIYTDKTEGVVNHSSVTYESWQESSLTLVFVGMPWESKL